MDYLNYLEMHSCDVFHWGEFGRAQDYDLLMVCSIMVAPLMVQSFERQLADLCFSEKNESVVQQILV